VIESLAITVFLVALLVIGVTYPGLGISFLIVAGFLFLWASVHYIIGR
jgi:hypothetical protein